MDIWVCVREVAGKLQMEGWSTTQACKMEGSPSSQDLVSENVPVIAHATKWSLTVLDLHCVSCLTLNEAASLPLLVLALQDPKSAL